MSHPMAEISICHNIAVKLNEPHYLELTFNEGVKRMRKDFTPDLPLVINW